MLDYSDHHRTVIAYHGTSVEAANRLVSDDEFEASDHDDEWFGRGVYCWEHAYKQAWWWATTHKSHIQPAVIGAVIRLGNCFDLLDPGNVSVLRGFYDKMIEDMKAEGLELPQNVRTRRRLDCALFNDMYAKFAAADQPLDTSRAVYVPTSPAKRLCKGSWISEETLIQICVRTPGSILAVWHVREDGRYGQDQGRPIG